MIKVSIIIPIYNVDKYLRRCIESVMAQTLKDIQIICVDDGSKDTCGAICDEYSKRDNRIIVIHKENGGLVTARKAGLNIASGKYIGFVDGDDWIEPELYEHMYNLAEEHQVSFVETGVIDSLDNGQKKRVSNFNEGCYKGDEYEKFIIPKLISFGEFYRYGIMPYLWNKLYRAELVKECYMKIGNKNYMCEDAACSYPYAIRGGSVYISHKCLYHYRVVNNSMKRTINEKVYEILFEQYKLIKQTIQVSKYKESLIKQLDCFMVYILLWNCPCVFDDLSSGEILFPFGGISKDDKIVIYGAGAAGIHIYDYLVNVVGVNVIMWVDKNYEHIKKEWEVKSPECIGEVIYDKVIVGIFRGNVVEEVKKWLEDNGVEKEKICWIQERYIKNPTILLDKIAVS